MKFLRHYFVKISDFYHEWFRGWGPTETRPKPDIHYVKPTWTRKKNSKPDLNWTRKKFHYSNLNWIWQFATHHINSKNYRILKIMSKNSVAFCVWWIVGKNHRMLSFCGWCIISKNYRIQKILWLILVKTTDYWKLCQKNSVSFCVILWFFQTPPLERLSLYVR